MNWKASFFVSALFLAACGSAVSTAGNEGSVRESLESKNRMNVSLLNQIRQMPGITLRNGVPVFTKSTSDVSFGVPIEPLYVLNGYPVGNSFADVDQLVENVNVEKIEALTDSDASFYGSRGAKGVIKITTRQ